MNFIRLTHEKKGNFDLMTCCLTQGHVSFVIPRLSRRFSKKLNLPLATSYTRRQPRYQVTFQKGTKYFENGKLMYTFGRIKTIIFFFKSQSKIQMFKLSSSNGMSCTRHCEEDKNRSNALGPSAYFKMGIGIERPFLL